MFIVCLGFAGGSADLPAMVDLGSTPGLGRSSGEGNSYPLQYSCLEICIMIINYKGGHI